jgi:hypothetical protein
MDEADEYGSEGEGESTNDTCSAELEPGELNTKYTNSTKAESSSEPLMKQNAAGRNGRDWPRKTRKDAKTGSEEQPQMKHRFTQMEAEPGVGPR